MMKKIRLILVTLHVLITIFLIYNPHFHLSFVVNSLNYEKQISFIIHYIINLFCISFYHSSCIIAIWYSHRYSTRIIGATGILLIGEFLQLIAKIIQHKIEIQHILVGELFINILTLLLFLTAIIITFMLAKKISQHEKDFMRVELLTNT